MDFRLVDFGRLEWQPTGSGGSVRHAGARLSVQTPVMAFQAGPGRQGWPQLALTLVPGDVAHEAWRAFVARLAASAAEALGLDPARCFALGATMQERLFGEELFFDEGGRRLDAPPAAGHAAALLDLTGVWSSARWGLRWKVRQVQLAPPRAPPPRVAPVNGETTVFAPLPTDACLLDDD